jgi:hypothetical protein
MTDDLDLTSDERHTLTCVLDELIPRSQDGRFPAAGELGLVAYVGRRMRQRPSLRATVRERLAALAVDARGRGASGFAALDHGDREAVLRQHEAAAPAFFAELLVEAYSGYYQHPRVLEALGLEARPPFPGGHRVEPSDLAVLLGSVRARPKMYRPG